MSIFGEILNRLRGKARPEPSTQASTQAQQPQTGASSQTQSAAPPATAPVTAGTGTGEAAAGGGTATTASQAPLSEVDVEKILDDLAQQSGQKLNWRTSIVDTMKALGLDSSLEHRKELARELQYSGDMNDSAAMNTWLHKRVMQELARNGGKLPPELRD
ncbi:DUF3597 domain-containing protein [Cupriavidus gilardii]|uniref:DUF3597 domain-containing protein n=1 Tax=Cupriavidus gilardii TaxID=82541 RepID=UPI0015812898|nr:DUF3597 domain-containing protein [Cupriavidus gilardii]MCT9074096.1 DUF3597 domain-containing protein [Cupriavidus gilardii]QKS61828.1 DUF3597 domain-containing protein [Cupriavidus gilardii]